MENKNERIEVFTVYALNTLDPYGGLSDKPINTFETYEEAERYIKSGYCDHWALTKDDARLQIRKTFTLKRYVPRYILRKKGLLE